MTLDPVINFAQFTVSQGYGSTDTSIVLSSGGSSLPNSGSFNAVWWNSTDYPNPALDPHVEIVRVNGAGISGNILPITRAQEGTISSNKNTAGKTYSIILAVTAKMITDIGSNLQQPWRYVNVSGTIDGNNATFAISPAPFDPNSIQISLARQPQIQGIDYTISGTTITYITPPPAALSGQPHIAQYQ